MACSDLWVIHQKKCNHGKKEVSSRLASDEITTHGYRVLTFAKCTTIMIAELAVTSGLGSSFD
jgi:hypothetical protein